MKTCNKCSKSQNDSNFSISHTNTDGLSDSCKKCNNEYAKIYYQKNKEKIADAQRNWQKKNKQKKYIIESNWVSKNKERRHYSTIKSKYSLSKEQFLEMVNAQKGFCKIVNRLSTLKNNVCI